MRHAPADLGAFRRIDGEYLRRIEQLNMGAESYEIEVPGKQGYLGRAELGRGPKSIPPVNGGERRGHFRGANAGPHRDSWIAVAGPTNSGI